MVENGMIVVSISQPGYGKSDGPPDFCGPYSQQTVSAVIDYFRKFDFVDKSKMALYGASRGAILASIVATTEPELAALLLEIGTYDLLHEYKRLKRLKSNEEKFSKIIQNIENETGASEEALKLRSAIYSAQKIRAPTLILNGEQDQSVDLERVKLFAEKIKDSGTPVKLVIYPNADHQTLPKDKVALEIRQFVGKYLFKN